MLPLRVKNLVGLATRPRPAVGSTPHTVVWAENKWRLLRYDARPEGLAHRTPVLLLPSLINRHYVLDLLPDKSLAGYLVAQGFDVFCVDWGTPGPEDRFLGLADIDRYLGRAARVTARLGGRPPHALGYCMGGTLAIVHAALHPQRFASLAVMAAPVRFDGEGVLGAWTRARRFDVDALVDAMGNVPWQILQASFHMLRPTLNLAKAVNLVDRAWNDRYLDGFLALETWANDNVSLPGEFYRSWLKDFYQADLLDKGELLVDGHLADLGAITIPTLAISFEHDSIAPAETCELLVERVASADKDAKRLPG
ncbi:MAG: alpha/beta fold hydrolase, partial [Myxococcales bacterium]|nr:alpha/beta fold hydrolase [Myxococcales bacterium]